jgi:hypothetical protein
MEPEASTMTISGRRDEKDPRARRPDGWPKAQIKRSCQEGEQSGGPDQSNLRRAKRGKTEDRDRSDHCGENERGQSKVGIPKPPGDGVEDQQSRGGEADAGPPIQSLLADNVDPPSVHQVFLYSNPLDPAISMLN